MAKRTGDEAVLPMTSRDVLAEILREGARRMLTEAIEQEVAEYLTEHADAVDADGRRLVVRNGHMPVRTIQTGLGDLSVARPRVNDRRVDGGGAVSRGDLLDAVHELNAFDHFRQ